MVQFVISTDPLVYGYAAEVNLCAIPSPSQNSLKLFYRTASRLLVFWAYYITDDILPKEILYLLGSDASKCINLYPSREIIHSNDQVLLSPFAFGNEPRKSILR